MEERGSRSPGGRVGLTLQRGFSNFVANVKRQGLFGGHGGATRQQTGGEADQRRRRGATGETGALRQSRAIGFQGIARQQPPWAQFQDFW